MWLYLPSTCFPCAAAPSKDYDASAEELDISRADRLRSLGNGVVQDQACAAFSRPANP